jgi:hypothetical protein
MGRSAPVSSNAPSLPRERQRSVALFRTRLPAITRESAARPAGSLIY